MIQVEVTKKMVSAAKKKAAEMGKLRNSITKGDGNLAGFLGEIIAQKILGGKIENTYDYDLVVDDATYDVKTKRCAGQPLENYECSVAAYNTKQKCDKYAFVRVQYYAPKQQWGPAWFLGVIDKDEYFNKAKFLKRGDIDKDNYYMVKADCYNLPISELNDHR